MKQNVICLQFLDSAFLLHFKLVLCLFRRTYFFSKSYFYKMFFFKVFFIDSILFFLHRQSKYVAAQYQLKLVYVSHCAIWGATDLSRSRAASRWFRQRHQPDYWLQTAAQWWPWPCCNQSCNDGSCVRWYSLSLKCFQVKKSISCTQVFSLTGHLCLEQS